jgi:hypothetical protein
MNRVGMVMLGKARFRSSNDHCAIMASVPSTWAGSHQAGVRGKVHIRQPRARLFDDPTDVFVPLRDQ